MSSQSDPVRPWVRWLLPALLLAAFNLVVSPVQGQDDANRAGLIIQHGDGTTSTACVTFEEPSMTGLELLRRAGISVSADVSSGLGTTICALDGEGCNYPEENCFCQCQGATCLYWQYWYLADGAWQYSQIGATDREVTDGSVNGWVWAEGDPSGGQKPPAISFAEVCAAEPAPTQSATPTEAPEEDPATAATPTQAATPTPTARPIPRPPTPTPVPPAGGGLDQLCTTNYLAFFAIVVILAGVIAGQLRRD